MAQHDYVIDNQSFPATRSDLNSLFQAIASCNSGATAPSTTYANQIWYDTANNKLYIRNEDNDAWIELFKLDQTGDHLEKIGDTITLDGTGNMSLAGDLTVDTSTLKVDSTNNRVGVGTASPGVNLDVSGTSADVRVAPSTTTNSAYYRAVNGAGQAYIGLDNSTGGLGGAYSLNFWHSGNYPIAFATNNTERMRIDNSGNLLVGKNSADTSTVGIEARNVGLLVATRSGGQPLLLDRLTNDGDLVLFRQGGTAEGSISVSGTTVSYNGGHLSRWSQLTDGTKDTSIVKGTVMTNLDQMAVWSHDAVAATYYVDGDELPEGVSVGDEKTPAKDAYTEQNEQLNCMAVSSVEGDTNVAGVFVNWDNDDDDFNDMNIAMTGDMVIRIAQGTTVARGDLLMSAGDGTAKPQDDDIVRSKTIAKVTSTNVSHTYDDGSYLVPCVLMAC